MAIIPTTWNDSDKGGNVTLSNGDLTVTIANYNNSAVRAIAGKSSGKWYWELTVVTRNAASYINAGVWPASRAIGTYIYNTTGVYRIVPSNHADGDVFGFAFDAGAGALQIARNGSALASVTGLSIAEPWHPVLGDDNTTSPVVITANFGAAPFAYTPPAGYSAGIGDVAYSISGVIEDASGAAAARLVRAHREDTGALAGSATSDGSTGAYSLATGFSGPHTLVAYPAAGENLPALTLRGVIPV